MEKSSSQVMKGIIWAAVASAMWGISGTVLQLISQNLAIPATWMLSMRTFSAGVILLVISVFLYGKKIFNVFKTPGTILQLSPDILLIQLITEDDFAYLQVFFTVRLQSSFHNKAWQLCGKLQKF